MGFLDFHNNLPGLILAKPYKTLYETITIGVFPNTPSVPPLLALMSMTGGEEGITYPYQYHE